jgi:tetratricopeptide (TPR) repeat protein
MERADWTRSAQLLEAVLEGEVFAPVDRYEIYAYLGRSYALSGRPHDAVTLFERCIAEVQEVGGDAALEARYATQLSYALSDMGELGRAEDVVAHALEKLDDSHDPYMRVRLFWSMARLAHAEGRESVALDNVRRAIALLQATDDTLHLARAHVLAANITLSRDDGIDASRHLDKAEQLLGSTGAVDDLIEIAIQRSRIAVLGGNGSGAVERARAALHLNAGNNPGNEGRAFSALGDALVLEGELPGAEEAYRRAAQLLEGQGRWREAATTCRSWARMLRENGREEQALDVLERATDLGMRATPTGAPAER